MRAIGLLILLFCILTVSGAETLMADAKIVQVDERGFILQVGTQPLAVEDNYESRFWKDRALVKRDAFKEGATVSVRIKTDADPPQLREMADKPTQAWLDSIRKEVKKGAVVKVDAKFLTFKFADGSLFAYRATDKTKITLQDKPNAALSDLKEGMELYAKGRLLPTLDTFLVEISDRAQTPAAKPDKKPQKAKLQPLKADGQLEGRITRHHQAIAMFDIETDRMLHITYGANTKFTLDGQAATKDAIRPQLRARIGYKRDAAGRILASRVDLFTN